MEYPLEVEIDCRISRRALLDLTFYARNIGNEPILSAVAHINNLNVAFGTLEPGTFTSEVKGTLVLSPDCVSATYDPVFIVTYQDPNRSLLVSGVTQFVPRSGLQ